MNVLQATLDKAKLSVYDLLINMAQNKKKGNVTIRSFTTGYNRVGEPFPAPWPWDIRNMLDPTQKFTILNKADIYTRNYDDLTAGEKQEIDKLALDLSQRDLRRTRIRGMKGCGVETNYRYGAEHGDDVLLFDTGEYILSRYGMMSTVKSGNASVKSVKIPAVTAESGNILIGGSGNFLYSKHTEKVFKALGIPDKFLYTSIFDVDYKELTTVMNKVRLEHNDCFYFQRGIVALNVLQFLISAFKMNSELFYAWTQNRNAINVPRMQTHTYYLPNCEPERLQLFSQLFGISGTTLCRYADSVSGDDLHKMVSSARKCLEQDKQYSLFMANCKGCRTPAQVQAKIAGLSSEKPKVSVVKPDSNSREARDMRKKMAQETLPKCASDEAKPKCASDEVEDLTKNTEVQPVVREYDAPIFLPHNVPAGSMFVQAPPTVKDIGEQMRTLLGQYVADAINQLHPADAIRCAASIMDMIAEYDLEDEEENVSE